MVCYAIEQKPNSCVVFSSSESGWTPHLSLLLGDYAVFFRKAQQLHASYVHQVSARSHNTAFVWSVPGCRAGFTVALSTQQSPHLLFTGWATMVTTGLSHTTDSGDGPFKANLHRKMNTRWTYCLHPAWRCMWTCPPRWWQRECTNQRQTSSPSLSTSTAGRSRPDTDCGETKRFKSSSG